MFGVDYEDLRPMCQQSRGAIEFTSYSYISGAFGYVSDSGSLNKLQITSHPRSESSRPGHVSLPLSFVAPARGKI